MQAWLPPEKSIFTLVTSRRKDFYRGFCHDLDRLADEEALALWCEKKVDCPLKS
jgi:hypothetical protein